MTSHSGFRRRAKFEVDPKAPFKNDTMDARGQVEALTRLLHRTPGPYVIAINADYGLGKTTFLRMWQAHLHGEGACTLFFDAWDHDFIEPPLVALIGELETQTTAIKGISKVADKLHKSGVAAIQAIAPVAAKEATKILLAAAATTVGAGPVVQAIKDALANVDKKDVEKEIGKAVGDIAKGQIEKYKKEKGTLQAFQKALAEFATAARGDSATAENKFLPLVYFIDELDRCRPTYAIELLETVKHLFSVEGIVFVLALNREALASAVQAIYGQSFDGAAYLRRFVDLQYNLPRPKLAEFCNQLAKEFIPPIELPFTGETGYYVAGDYRQPIQYQVVIAKACRQYAPVMKASLRDLEQVFSRAGAALGSLKTGQHVEPTYFTFLLLVQEAVPEAFSMLKYQRNASALLDTLRTALGKFAFAHGDLLDSIVNECLGASVETAEKYTDRLHNARKIWQQADGADQKRAFITWAVLQNGQDRIRSAIELVDFAARFQGTGDNELPAKSIEARGG